LEKHAEQLGKYSCPLIGGVEEILSRTYYKIQMPSTLLERLEYYNDQIKDLDKKEHYARRAMLSIVNKNVLAYLKKKHHLSTDEILHFDFIKVLTKSRHFEVDLNTHTIYKLLLTNQKIQTYFNRVYYRHVYKKIRITYSNEAHHVNLDEFDERIWKECLKEASENTEIIQMKENAEALLEEVWNLIEEITRY